MFTKAPMFRKIRQYPFPFAMLAIAAMHACGGEAEKGSPIPGARNISLDRESVETSEAGDDVTVNVSVFPLSGDEVITITFESDREDEATVTPSTLIFTADNHDQEQTVTIRGTDDDIADGDKAFKIEIQANLTGSVNEGAIAVGDIDGTNADDDAAGFVVSPGSLGLVSEGQTKTFTVRLSSEPLGNVSIPLSNPSGSDLSLSTAALTFTSANWNVPQTVTVSVLSDGMGEPIEGFSIGLQPASSSDETYDGLNPSDVSIAIQS